MIYRVNDWMRIGGAFHSPTAFRMHDTYTYAMNTSFESQNYTSTTPSGTYDYNLITPPRLIGNLGFVIAKKGLIGIDYEVIDYTYARFNSTPNTFFEVNDQVRKKYKSASNIRIGGELRVIENIALRAGFALYGSPYKGGVNRDASRTTYSAGIGFREKNFFIDLAYMVTQYKEDYYLYDPTYTKVKPVLNSFSASSFLATIGVKF